MAGESRLGGGPPRAGDAVTRALRLSTPAIERAARSSQTRVRRSSTTTAEPPCDPAGAESPTTAKPQFSPYDTIFGTHRQARDIYIDQIRRRKQILAARSPHGAKLGTAVTALDSYVGTPRPSPVMVWTPEQTRRFLDRAESHRLYALYHLIAFRGLRRGEACGLRWPELDPINQTVIVRWQIVQVGATTTQGPPKSDAGDHQVALDRRTTNVLLVHKARQNNERLTTGDDWTDTGFIFTTETGQPLHPAAVTEQFHWLCMEADLPPIRLHDLRHGAATLLLAAGHDMKIVQETLGLSSITIAADTYTSVLPDLARQAAEDVATLVRPNTGRRRTLGRARDV